MPSRQDVLETVLDSTYSDWDAVGDSYIYTDDVQISIQLEELRSPIFTNAVPEGDSPVRELEVSILFNNQPIYQEIAYESVDNEFIAVADDTMSLTDDQAKFSSVLRMIVYGKPLSVNYLQKKGYSIE